MINEQLLNLHLNRKKYDVLNLMLNSDVWNKYANNVIYGPSNLHMAAF